LSSSTEPKRFRATARAKVNLALEVLRRRPDGYHEVETILQTISLADELELSFNRTSRVRISCNDPEIPTDERNLCARAVAAMRTFAGRELGADIRIDKKIPQCAGLGGGSADAAAVILAANRAEDLELPQDALDRAALECGSDVPFMLRGGTMLGRGRGEELTPLTAVQRGVFVIVKPPVDISTAWVYKNVNFQLTRHRYRFNLKAVNALLARFPSVGISLRNALEDVVCPSYPSVSEVLEELLSSRPYMASMSGSGSALFAVVENEEKASRLAERFAVRGFFATVAVPCTRAVDLYPVEAR
jgi:4-diphosphocytidyl-2-C-methyl-D-erythritol kinase